MSASAIVSAPSFASLSFDEKLDRLAEVAVRVGLGLRPGQELVLTAPIDALPLVRRIADHAYRAGALLVTTLFADDPCVLSRYEHAPDASFDYAPVWLQDAIATAFKSGAARMAISDRGRRCSRTIHACCRGMSMRRMRASTMRRCGCRTRLRRRSRAARHGWRLRGRTRRCWLGRTRRRWRGRM